MLITLRSILDAETAVPVRIGVNKGHVFAGDIGPAYRRTYTVMGDAVNLAARVMSMAVATKKSSWALTIHPGIPPMGSCWSSR